jgi:signal transduction histidine kinase
MNIVAQKSATAFRHGVLLGLADAELAHQFAAAVGHFQNHGQVSVAPNLGHLEEMSAKYSPHAILLDEDLLEDAPLVKSVHELNAFAPVILVAAPARQPEIAQLVAKGGVDFVARVGDFVPLAAGLIERRLRWAEFSASALASSGLAFSEDIGEIFRHEINNPLTGILGNAELLLAHRDHFPSVDLQRLQTVVDLAVRLRETVRRVSNAWESQPPSQ